MAELDLKLGKTFIARMNTYPEMTPMQARRMRSSISEYPLWFRPPSSLRERTFISTPKPNSPDISRSSDGASPHHRSDKNLLGRDPWQRYKNMYVEPASGCPALHS